MSIQKIARMAGVSVATVSRVLNNSDSVKPANRQKVLEAIEESNYQPNLLARQLRTARSSMILVLVSDISNPFCAEVVKGIEEQAEKNGYRILLCNSGADIARFAIQPATALRQDGGWHYHHGCFQQAAGA
ncbi:Catabolite control protein [Pantoea agglomerans]|uniref:Catabolite control protein n=1 Tax=Enterobacter agglomerans TaxID=549 RepID=A0A379LQZ4_ENTAG|nr:Catabolite control protein [Pantoea agglomerans]